MIRFCLLVKLHREGSACAAACLKAFLYSYKRSFQPKNYCCQIELEGRGCRTSTALYSTVVESVAVVDLCWALRMPACAQGWTTHRSSRDGPHIEALGMDHRQKFQGWTTHRSSRDRPHIEAIGMDNPQKIQGWTTYRSSRDGPHIESIGMGHTQKLQGWTTHRSSRDGQHIEALGMDHQTLRVPQKNLDRSVKTESQSRTFTVSFYGSFFRKRTFTGPFFG